MLNRYCLLLSAQCSVLSVPGARCSARRHAAVPMPKPISMPMPIHCPRHSAAARLLCQLWSRSGVSLCTAHALTNSTALDAAARGINPRHSPAPAALAGAPPGNPSVSPCPGRSRPRGLLHIRPPLLMEACEAAKASSSARSVPVVQQHLHASGTSTSTSTANLQSPTSTLQSPISNRPAMSIIQPPETSESHRLRSVNGLSRLLLADVHLLPPCSCVSIHSKQSP